jgi:hypothetical protein
MPSCNSKRWKAVRTEVSGKGSPLIVWIASLSGTAGHGSRAGRRRRPLPSPAAEWPTKRALRAPVRHRTHLRLGSRSALKSGSALPGNRVFLTPPFASAPFPSALLPHPAPHTPLNARREPSSWQRTSPPVSHPGSRLVSAQAIPTEVLRRRLAEYCAVADQNAASEALAV